jgi:hypothetical protein
MKIISLARERIREHMFLLSISHLLEKMGVKIVPFYITRESLSDSLELNLEPKLKPISCGFLLPAEIKDLYSMQEINGLMNEAEAWQNSGCLCFALKHEQEYAAYMWCNLHQCNSDFSPFPLEPYEAYLFRARTMDKYRGKNLAPFLRYELYKQLIERKYTTFYSITEYLNAPAVKFKKKLKAQHVKFGLYVGVFHKRLIYFTFDMHPRTSMA